MAQHTRDQDKQWEVLHIDRQIKRISDSFVIHASMARFGMSLQKSPVVL